MIVIVHYLNGHFGICLGIELIAFADHFIAKFLIVLDNTVVDSDNIHVVRDMRVGIVLGRFAVCCPACVTDSAISRHCLAGIRLLGEHSKSPLRFHDRRYFIRISHCQAGRIISPVFQF